MDKYIIIGLDLSLNSTGICVGYFEDNAIKKMKFARIVFGKSIKKQLVNVDQFEYKMPVNVTTNSLMLGETGDGIIVNLDAPDEIDTTYEQTYATIKGLTAAKNINAYINSTIDELAGSLDCIPVFFAIENYVMPDYGGKNQLKTVGALIMLQGFVRRDIIMNHVSINSTMQAKFLLTVPSELKKFFTSNGNADKDEMMVSFIKNYDGQTLLPDAGLDTVDVLNDCIDAFALLTYAYSKIIKLK